MKKLLILLFPVLLLTGCGKDPFTCEVEGNKVSISAEFCDRSIFSPTYQLGLRGYRQYELPLPLTLENYFSHSDYASVFSFEIPLVKDGETDIASVVLTPGKFEIKQNTRKDFYDNRFHKLVKTDEIFRYYTDQSSFTYYDPIDNDSMIIRCIKSCRIMGAYGHLSYEITMPKSWLNDYQDIANILFHLIDYADSKNTN